MADIAPASEDHVALFAVLNKIEQIDWLSFSSNFIIISDIC